MRRKRSFIYPLIFALLTLSWSCKKSSDISPKVTLLSPAAGSNYTFGDTIRVTAEIEDSDGNYLLNVYEGSRSLGLSTRKVSSSGTTTNFEVYYDRKDISRGNYELKLTAYNGESRDSDFSNIYLEEVPQEFLGLMLLGEGSSGANLIKLDASLNNQNIALQGDYKYLAFSASQEIAMAAPVSDGRLKGFSVQPFGEVYSINPTVPSGAPLYTGLVNADDHIFALSENGELKAYGQNGSVERSLQLAADKLPVCGCYSNEGLVLCVKVRGTSNYVLQLLNPITGAVLKEKPVPHQIVDVINPSQGLYSVAMKRSGQTVLGNYRPATNTFTQTFTISGSPLCMMDIKDGEALISTTTGVQFFKPESGAMPTGVFSVTAIDMDYDPVNRNIYLVNGSNLYRGTLSGGGESFVFQTSVSLKQVQVVLNK